MNVRGDVLRRLFMWGIVSLGIWGLIAFVVCLFGRP